MYVIKNIEKFLAFNRKRLVKIHSHDTASLTTIFMVAAIDTLEIESSQQRVDSLLALHYGKRK